MSEPFDFRVEAGDIMLANRHVRDHWTERKTAVWRTAAYYSAIEAGVPRPFGRCDVLSRAVYPLNKRGKLPDTSSWYPTTKAIIDGLVDYGCWRDDSSDVGVRWETYMDPIRHGSIVSALVAVRLVPVLDVEKPTPNT